MYTDVDVIENIKLEISPIYSDYINNVSCESVATSLEQCAFLVYFLRTQNINKVLDTGSGISSFFIRYVQKNKYFETTTFETDPRWLKNTEDYIKKYNLNYSNIFLWDEVKSNTRFNQFDFVYHDMGNIETRIETLQNMIDRVCYNGFLMLDDAHFNVPPTALYSNLIQNVFSDNNMWMSFDIKDISIDRYGRFAVLYKKLI